MLKTLKETALTMLVSATTITLNFFSVVNAVLGTIIAIGTIVLLYYQIRKAMREHKK